eukprot:2960471-Rhodomonas_salina.1
MRAWRGQASPRPLTSPWPSSPATRSAALPGPPTRSATRSTDLGRAAPRMRRPRPPSSLSTARQVAACAPLQCDAALTQRGARGSA